MIEYGDWQVSQIAHNAFDFENKVVGTGRNGHRVLQRLVPARNPSITTIHPSPLVGVPRALFDYIVIPWVYHRILLTWQRRRKLMARTESNALKSLSPSATSSPRGHARGLAREHHTGRGLRQGHYRGGTQERAAVRLRGRCVERAAGTKGPRLAHGEEPPRRWQRRGAPLLGHDPGRRRGM